MFNKIAEEENILCLIFHISFPELEDLIVFYLRQTLTNYFQNKVRGDSYIAFLELEIFS